MQKGVEVPVQTIEEPESYLVYKKPSYGKYRLFYLRVFPVFSSVDVKLAKYRAKQMSLSERSILP